MKCDMCRCTISGYSVTVNFTENNPLRPFEDRVICGQCRDLLLGLIDYKQVKE